MRLRQFLLFSLLISIYITACEKVDIQYGTQYLDNQYTQIVKVDTFSTDISTVFVDSFQTSGTGITLLGGYTDSAFGRIDTKCYFELTPPAYTKSYDSTHYDSLRLILKLNKSYYGDTTKPLHLDVNRLSQQINFPENQFSFYNKQEFSVFPAVIGSGDFLLKPTFYSDSISIKLDDNLGRELLSKLKNASDQDLQTDNNFLYYFNGLRISSNSSANMIVNCTDNIVMRLSYSKPGSDTLEKHHIDFTMTNKEHHFNNITTNRSALSTPLKKIDHFNNIIPGASMGNRAFTQYTSNVMARIKFPSIKELLKLPNYVKILTAKLKVVPMRGSYDTYYFLPPSLTLCSTDLTNTVGSPLVVSGTGQAQNGNLYLDNTYNDNTVYTYDVSNYIKNLVQNPLSDNYGLLLLPPSTSSRTEFSRIIIGNKNLLPENKNTTKLEIYYLTVQPQ
jgi:hypothetical protein